MKVGSLIQHRLDAMQSNWGLGVIIDHCPAGTCDARVSVSDHWVIHFPNRKYKKSTAEFIHTQVSRGLNADNLKWMVIA